MQNMTLAEVANDILNIWGDEAERICSNRALAAESAGDQTQAAGWRRIRHAISSIRIEDCTDR